MFRLFWLPSCLWLSPKVTATDDQMKRQVDETWPFLWLNVVGNVCGTQLNNLKNKGQVVLHFNDEILTLTLI